LLTVSELTTASGGVCGWRAFWLQAPLSSGIAVLHQLVRTMSFYMMLQSNFKPVKMQLMRLVAVEYTRLDI
jgi:hypothetical protein